MDITGGEGVDHIVEVDFAANFPVTSQVLKSSGVVAVYAAGTGQQPPVPLQFRSSNVVVRMVLVYDMPEPAKDAAIDDITRWLETGALTHQLGPRFPLDQVVQAHQAVEGGAIGNVIVDVAPA
jgi:NADPH2:quinone reductase